MKRLAVRSGLALVVCARNCQDAAKAGEKGQVDKLARLVGATAVNRYSIASAQGVCLVYIHERTNGRMVNLLVLIFTACRRRMRGLARLLGMELWAYATWTALFAQSVAAAMKSREQTRALRSEALLYHMSMCYEGREEAPCVGNGDGAGRRRCGE